MERRVEKPIPKSVMVRSASTRNAAKMSDVQDARAALLGVDEPLLAEAEAEERREPLAGARASGPRAAARGAARRGAAS